MSRIHEALIRAGQEQKAGASSPPADSTGQQLLELSALLTSQTDSGLTMEPDADELTGCSLFSRFSRPAWRPAENMLFLQAEIEDSAWAEQFRTLRSRLYRLRQKQAVKTILVTSPLPREGKSFVSANLSQMFAQQHGCRTLLIDADLRRSRLHEYLGAPCSPGLPDYLSGKADEYAIVQRSPVPDLFFIPGGLAHRPAELIGTGRMKLLLEELKPLFDWIVIDSPPVNVVSDVGVLAGLSDGVVLVVRSGFTRYGIAQRARDELKDRPLLGVVLNAAPQDGNLDTYYSYGGYYSDSQNGAGKGHQKR